MLKVITGISLSISIILLLGGGIYFSIKLSFPQLQWKKLFRGFKTVDNTSISPFKSLMVSLAARVGVGSLAGIALAIYIGGSGTIFWIWIIGIITSVNAYCESYLGVKYQEKDKKEYKGGPPYYIEKGLNNKKLAIIYAILIIFAYILGFMTIQANTITVSLKDYLDPIIIAIILSVISYLSIRKGLKEIVNITSKLVPIMGLIYIILSIIIIIMNYHLLPDVLKNIIINAWNFKSFSSSFIPTFLIGVQRGIFSTEAGLGTGSIASSCTYTKDKVGLGLIQILGVYFTVFIVCTSTALIILTSKYQDIIFGNINGIELTQYALNYHLGNIGSKILIILILFLAYSTIVAGYYYGESSLRYLIKNIKAYQLKLLKILTVMLLFIGSIVSSNIIWKIVDILVILLAIFNMYSLLKLRKEIIFDYKKNK